MPKPSTRKRTRPVDPGTGDTVPTSPTTLSGLEASPPAVFSAGETTAPPPLDLAEVETAGELDEIPPQTWPAFAHVWIKQLATLKRPGRIPWFTVLIVLYTLGLFGLQSWRHGLDTLAGLAWTLAMWAVPVVLIGLVLVVGKTLVRKGWF